MMLLAELADTIKRSEYDYVYELEIEIENIVEIELVTYLRYGQLAGQQQLATIANMWQFASVTDPQFVHVGGHCPAVLLSSRE
ncbi:MAG: hypothetical protein LBH06_05645 [Rikenellaceae bacterium]|jgi:hypothetical protein|nr:hypothetical protein [Rikenellaceae bacterium]